MILCFGDIVVVEGDLIGVVVKSWVNDNWTFNEKKDIFVQHDVYVRVYNEIRTYREERVERYMVRHKELNEEEIQYQRNAISNQ
jgi:hypothetical protein